MLFAHLYYKYSYLECLYFLIYIAIITSIASDVPSANVQNINCVPSNVLGRRKRFVPPADGVVGVTVGVGVGTGVGIGVGVGVGVGKT